MTRRRDWSIVLAASLLCAGCGGDGGNGGPVVVAPTPTPSPSPSPTPTGFASPTLGASFGGTITDPDGSGIANLMIDGDEMLTLDIGGSLARRYQPGGPFLFRTRC